MISIIIPTHNRRVYLGQALESILNQKGVRSEIIIIDDASTDGTEAYIKNLGLTNIIYIRNEISLFAHGARKKGYQYVSGDYVIFMDDDDFYIDNYFFYRAENVLKQNKDISVVIGSTSSFNGDIYSPSIDLGGDGVITNVKYINGFGSTYFKPQSTLSAVFRKSALDKHMFSDLRMINDTCIYLLGIIPGNVFLFNKAVAAYRVHCNNISKSRFSLYFIKDCLETKRDIFYIARAECALAKPYYWYSHQIFQSASYFIISSKNNIIICIFILCWILVRASGARFFIMKELFTKIK